MAWTEEAWAAIDPIYQNILSSNFVTELCDGTLLPERFATYMQQDKLYLNDHGRALAYIAARAPNPEGIAMFSRLTIVTVEAEQELHDFYLDFNKNDPESVRRLGKLKKHITCELYTSFLLRHASCSPLELAVAAVLPCFWIYDSVGIHHQSQIKKLVNTGEENPYAKWSQMYSSAEFTEGTRQVCDFANKLAKKTTPERRQEMIEVFKQAALMELSFWRAAWDNEQWIA